MDMHQTALKLTAVSLMQADGHADLEQGKPQATEPHLSAITAWSADGAYVKALLPHEVLQHHNRRAFGGGAADPHLQAHLSCLVVYAVHMRPCWHIPAGCRAPGSGQTAAGQQNLAHGSCMQLSGMVTDTRDQAPAASNGAWALVCARDTPA